MNAQPFDFTTPQFKSNPFLTLADMREAGPLVRVNLPLVGEAWMATTYEACSTLLRDHDTFVQEGKNAGKQGVTGLKWWMPSVIKAMARNMLTMDEPDHRRLRNLVDQAFQRHSVEEMRPRIGELVDQFLDQLETAASDQPTGVDFLENFARPLPLAVIGEMLGLPKEDRPRFMRWAAGLTNVGSVWGMFRASPGIWRLSRYLKRRFQICREQPQPGMISALVEAESDGHRLGEDELLAMSFLLLFAGHETTVHLISNSVLALCEHPDQKAALAADWSAAPRAVDELLRFTSPVQMTKPRSASCDMEFFGQQLKQGDILMALLASANSDPEKFDDPETLDLARHPNPHLGFGAGIHVCLGLKLARAEVGIALERLFTRFPNFDLAVPVDQLRWFPRIGTRGMYEMPVQLNAEAETVPLKRSA